MMCCVAVARFSCAVSSLCNATRLLRLTEFPRESAHNLSAHATFAEPGPRVQRGLPLCSDSTSHTSQHPDRGWCQEAVSPLAPPECQCLQKRCAEPRVARLQWVQGGLSPSSIRLKTILHSLSVTNPGAGAGRWWAARRPEFGGEVLMTTCLVLVQSRRNFFDNGRHSISFTKTH